MASDPACVTSCNT